MPPKRVWSGVGTPTGGGGTPQGGTPVPSDFTERANIAPLEKPWKNPSFQKKASARNKTAKAVLIAERERTLPLEERIARKKKKAASRGFAADTAEVVAMVESEEAAAAKTGPTVTYYSIEAPPSLLPQKRYCDITGLEAPYTDPKSMLRYHNAEVYALLKTFLQIKRICRYEALVSDSPEYEVSTRADMPAFLAYNAHSLAFACLMSIIVPPLARFMLPRDNERVMEEPYWAQDRYRGTAPIKAEYVKWQLVLSGTSHDAAEADSAAADGPQEPEHKKAKRDHKNKKSRGQNKARSFVIAKDAVQLCSWIARERDCPREDCKFSHDLKAYLALKGRDIQYDLPAGLNSETKRVCPVFAEIGACSYGYKCRFLESHLERLPEGEGYQSAGLRLRLREDVALLDATSLNTLLDTKGERNVVSADARGKFRPALLAKELPGAHNYLTEIGATLQDLIESREQHKKGRKHTNGMMKNDSSASLASMENGPNEGGDDGNESDEIKPIFVAAQLSSSKQEPTRADSNAEPVATASAVTSAPLKNAESALHRNEGGMTFGPPDVPMRAVEKRRLDFRDRYYLAPLTTVGNLPFRRLCGAYGSDVHCGEMGIASEYTSGNPSEWALLKRHTSEKTFGVQVCGSRPHQLVPVAEAIVKTCPDVDFVDVNCGCPIDLVVKKGAGSALLEHPAKLGKSLVGMSRVLGEIPLTIKLRTGIRDNDLVAHKLVGRIRSWGVGAITLHGRTRQQRYTRMADYAYIKHCVSALREACEDDDLPRVPFVGNGDAYDHRDFWQNIEMTGVDTIMVARGALVKPWIFTELRERRDWDISARERLDGIQRLANYGLAHWGSDTQGLCTTRRFLCEALSFQHRYIPVGLLEHLPARLNLRPLPYQGRDELETLLSSGNASDWDRIASMFLGPPPTGWSFTPKHKSNSYADNNRGVNDAYEANG